MNTEEFFKACDDALSYKDVLEGARVMESFGAYTKNDELQQNQKGVRSIIEKEKESRPLRLSSEESALENFTVESTGSDFDDDFSDLDNPESTQEPSDEFDEAFDDLDFNYEEPASSADSVSESVSDAESIEASVSEFTESVKPLEVPGEFKNLKSVTVISAAREDSSTLWSIRKELVENYNNHGVSEEDILRGWNFLYNDTLLTEADVIEKWLRVHYGLWCDSYETVKFVLEQGKEFLEQLRFSYRVCTITDAKAVSEVWKEEWYDSNAINEFAITQGMLSLVLQLLRSGKYNKEIMGRYRDNPEALLCCIRLLQAEKLIVGEFDAAINRGEVVVYTNATLNNSTDRFDCIKHRKTFEQDKAFIINFESNGGIVQQETLEKYKDVFYLQDVVRAASDGRENSDFINAFLLEDLEQFDFIAKMYGDGSVDVTFDPTDFFYDVIMTDAQKFGLPLENITTMKNERGLSCLVCSRYGAKNNRLTEVDYRKFIAIIALDEIGDNVRILSSEERLIKGYNAFWFRQLVNDIGVACTIPEDIEDNILFVKYVDSKKRKYYLQVDDYVLNRKEFLELFGDVNFAQTIAGGNGIILSNGVEANGKTYSYPVDSSLTTWAKGKVDEALMKQFSVKEVVTHANFVLALDAASQRFREATGNSLQISSSVMDFLTMPQKEYYVHDKMFGFVSKRPEFLGIFASKNAVTLLKLFSNTCVYDSVPKIMFMFLYIVFLKYARQQLYFDSTGFTTLDSNKNVLLVDSSSFKSTCMNFRTVSDSIDNFIRVAQNSREVHLKISERTINIQFN